MRRHRLRAAQAVTSIFITPSNKSTSGRRTPGYAGSSAIVLRIVIPGMLLRAGDGFVADRDIAASRQPLISSASFQGHAHGGGISHSR
jgi:hypothetical protein